MKKTQFFRSILFLILFVMSNISPLQAQNIKGVITYSKQIFFPKLDVMSKEQSNFMQKKITESSKMLEYILQFNNSESIFVMNENLDKDNSFVKLASSLSGGKGIYYTNKNGYLHQKESYGNLFLIKYDSRPNWKMINKTKKIGKYLCYKATTIKVVESIKTFKKTVTAWYCPELPYSFGPIGYTGLPGLILELNIEKGATFTVKNIELSKSKTFEIIKPTKGKQVTEKEYNDIGRDMYNKRKEGF